MKQFEIEVSPELTEKQVVTKLTQSIEQLGLVLKSECTLKTVPGSIHWHFTKPNQKGTLEATLDTKSLRLWVGFHDNRYADWMDDAVEMIKFALERE